MNMMRQLKMMTLFAKKRKKKIISKKNKKNKKKRIVSNFLKERGRKAWNGNERKKRNFFLKLWYLIINFIIH